MSGRRNGRNLTTSDGVFTAAATNAVTIRWYEQGDSKTEVFQERPFLNNLPSSSKCGNELPTRPPTGLDNRRANTRYVHLTRLKLLNSKNFFKGGHSVVDGQLFTILVPSLHNVQNQMYCYIWLRLATCFGRYPAIIRPTRNSVIKVYSTSFSSVFFW